MAQHGAAIHLPQAELTPQTLADLLQGLDRAALQAMAEKARTLARPRAAARVADEIAHWRIDHETRDQSCALRATARVPTKRFG